MRTFAICWLIAFCFLAFKTRGAVAEPEVVILGNAMLSTILCMPLMAGVLVIGRCRRFVKGGVVAAGASLDHGLFNWTKEDAYTLRDLHASVAIFGQVGSGKSSGSGLLFARTVLKVPGSGVLVLGSKPEDRQFWIDRAREAGRLDDLIIFDDSGRQKFNFLDFIRASSGDSREITHFLMTTSEALEGGAGNDNDPFWRTSQQRLIFNAVEALRLGEGAVTVPRLQEFISTAAQSPATFADPEAFAKWKKSPHNLVMEAADRKAKTSIEKYDFQSVTSYWTKEFPAMDNKPRSSIMAGVMNTLQTYNTGLVRELVSTTSTFDIRDLERGKIIVTDLAIDRLGESAKIILHGLKLSAQKHILKRHVQPGDATICIFADECQQVVNSFDPDFMSRCRSHYGCQIFLTQSLHSYFGEAHGHAGEHKAKALLTNFKTKIFHTLGDHDTAAYASSLVGKRREAFTSFSSGGDREGTGNFSEQYEDVLKPVDLLTGLRTSGGVVDGWVIKSGEPFHQGTNHLRISFDQS